MSKPIRVTQAMKDEIMAEVAKKLDNMMLFDGKQTLPIDYHYPGKDHATVVFSRLAWEKQLRLVDEFSSEIGWHGLVHRDADDPSVFYIDDLLVFPQEVTGATVTPEQGAYDRWNAMLPPEQRNTMRYHGHSHVRMGTTPSSTDNTFQKDLIGRLNGDGYTEEVRQRMMEELGESAFYIFMIWNKSREFNVRIFDLYNNVFYEGKEVSIIADGMDDLNDFLADAKAKVKTRTYQSGYYYNGNGSGNYWDRYNAQKTPSTQPASTTPGNKVIDLPTADKKPTTPAIPSGSRASMDDKDHESFPSGYFDGQVTIYD